MSLADIFANRPDLRAAYDRNELRRDDRRTYPYALSGYHGVTLHEAECGHIVRAHWPRFLTQLEARSWARDLVGPRSLCDICAPALPTAAREPVRRFTGKLGWPTWDGRVE